MKQFFVAVWDFLHQLGQARYQRRSRNGIWDY